MILNEFRKQIKTAFLLFILLSIITGLLYPGFITLIAQTFFPWRANGSLIEVNGQVIGSALIGQSFSDPAYFWGRPSATPSHPYNAEYSGGSNLGPMNPILISQIKNRVSLLEQSDKTNHNLIPIDLVTSSGSGLDPDISPEAAFYQVTRISRIRHVAEDDIMAIINKIMTNRTLTLLGEPRLNVLQLNLALSPLSKPEEAKDRHERP